MADMDISQILLYTGRAILFALGVGIVWTLLLRRSKALLKKLPFVCYLAALVQITVIRDWAALFTFPEGSHTLKTVQLIPFRTTLTAMNNGLWPFCFHVIGNMIWFVPLGVLDPIFFRRLRNTGWLFFCAAGLSSAIELSQWCLGTGVSDVDDIILNTAGALCGYLIWTVFIKRHKSCFPDSGTS